MGIIYETENKHKEAQECLEKIITNNEAPKTLKKRVSTLVNYIKNNQEKTE
jgi:ribosomal protein L17